MTEPPDDSRDARLLAAVFCNLCQISYVPRENTEAICPQCGQSPCIDATTIWDGQDPNHAIRAKSFTEMDSLVGQEIGIYQIEGFLGAGAMGRVYLARHRDLHRYCALKLLPPLMVEQDPGYVTRFQNEAQAAAALDHPNVVTVHAIGRERGYHFLEMEFVAGQSLQQLVAEEGAQTPERATALTARVANGLAAAHEKGVLHRDLKLDNIILSHQGIPKIADFGLAKRVLLGTSFDTTREIVGTPAYMAPELFEGASATPASDVYALGVCFHLLATGQFPFYSDNISELMRQVKHQPLQNPRKLAPRLTLEMAECLHLMLSKTPSNRPANALGACQLLLAVLGQFEDLEDLVREAFQGHQSLNWKRRGEEFEIHLVFPTGRQQTVWVAPSEHAVAERLLTITSLCAKATPAYFETALRLNSEMQHGALAIKEIDGNPYFVVVDTYPRATVDAEEIRRSVLEVAHRADAVERLLSDHDVH